MGSRAGELGVPQKALSGRGLLQSPEEWAARNDALASTLSELINAYVQPRTFRGLDVGCQDGLLTDLLARQTGFPWWGVDPQIQANALSAGGAELMHGWAHQLPFPDAHFDCALLANVYEHVPPDLRAASLTEISRVLPPGGLLVGQLPNPYFPIEAHSRLPLMGWLPLRLRRVYWHLAPVPWAHNFYAVTPKDLKRKAQAAGLETVVIRNFNYPVAALPRRVQRLARLLSGPMRLVPWAWQFAFRRT